MNTDKFELKPVDMFAQSPNNANHTSSNSSLGYISGHKIVLTPKELSVQNDNMAIIHIKSIKFSPADYNKKSIKNLLCGELLYRIKRYLYYDEKVSIDRIIKDFNKKFESIVQIDSIESIDAFLQKKSDYEQCKAIAKPHLATTATTKPTEFGL